MKNHKISWIFTLLFKQISVKIREISEIQELIKNINLKPNKYNYQILMSMAISLQILDCLEIHL